MCVTQRIYVDFSSCMCIINFNWCENHTHGIYLYLILLPEFATSCFFSSEGWCLIRHKNTSTVTLWTAVADGRKACLEPIKSLFRSEIQSVKRRTTNVEISSPQPSVSESNHSDSPSVSYSHSHGGTFLDRHTYSGIRRYIKTEVDGVECNLSVTWIIPVQLAILSSLIH